MKTEFIPALKLTFLSLVFFSVLYTLLVWGIAQATPNAGKGEMLSQNNKTVGFANVGQSFTDSRYFWGRPSAVGYNAAASGGSNKGPSNPDYLAQVAARIDTFLVYHPTLKRADVPSELVTASGSGLDPDISPASALVQVARVAKARKVSEEKIRQLVQAQIEKPAIGPEKVNVLKLNLALGN